MSTFIALLKREVLEHKNIWRVPLILIGLAILIRISLSFGNLAINVNLPKQLQLDNVVNSVVSGVIGKSLHSMNFIVMVVMFIVAVFYALSSLYNERQDESVLFWRSLPISDSLTVLSKLCVGLIVIPLIVILMQSMIVIVFLGGDSLEYLAHYLSSRLPVFCAILLWSLLPIIAWCMFCSGMAKKSPFLLAVIVPILLIFVDKLFLKGVISQIFVINRISGTSNYTGVALLVGILFSIVVLVLAVLKRSQRV